MPSISKHPITPALISRSTRRHDARPWLLALSALIILLDRAQQAARSSLTSRSGATYRSSSRASSASPTSYNTGAAFSATSRTPLSPENVRNASHRLLRQPPSPSFSYMLWRSGRALTLSSGRLALILGGAIGNLYDRIVLPLRHRLPRSPHQNHYFWPELQPRRLAASSSAPACSSSKSSAPSPTTSKIVDFAAIRSADLSQYVSRRIPARNTIMVLTRPAVSRVSLPTVLLPASSAQDRSASREPPLSTIVDAIHVRHSRLA